MATAWVKGSASLVYTPNGGTELVHLLAVPLGIVRELVPARVWGEHHDWWSADKRHRRIVTVGGPSVHEITAVNRLDNQPVEFMDLLEQAMLFDLTVTYIPVDGGAEYPLRIVSVGSESGGVSIIGDRQRFGGGEWEQTFRARRTDGGSLSGLISSS